MAADIANLPLPNQLSCEQIAARIEDRA